MKPSEQLQYQASTIHDLIAGTSADQLNDATPCAKWNVHDLMEHLIGGAHFFGGAFSGQPMEADADAPAPDLLGEDPAAAWDGAVQAFSEGVDSPGALERNLTLPFGTLPGTAVLELLKFDLLVHAWDLAQATNQPFDPPDQVVQPAMGAAEKLISPEARDGDAFAAEVTVTGDASPMEKLAAFSGRAIPAH